MTATPETGGGFPAWEDKLSFLFVGEGLDPPSAYQFLTLKNKRSKENLAEKRTIPKLSGLGRAVRRAANLIAHDCRWQSFIHYKTLPYGGV
jgi:hypothetical protein